MHITKCPLKISIEFPTNYSIENLKYCPINCVRIPIPNIFLVFNSDLLPVSSADVSYEAVVFQLCKMHVFNQPNAVVLIAQ